MMKLLLELFSASLWKITIIMLMIHFSIQFGYYGLFNWFPTLFDKLEKYHEQYPNVTKGVCEIVSESIEEELPDDDCDHYIPDDSVFINSFLISLSAAPR